MIPSVDKDRHGFDGQKYAHTASSPLTIRQVFSSGLSLSVRIWSSGKTALHLPAMNFRVIFVFLRCRRAGARQGEKGKKHRKGTLSGVFALVNRWYVWSFKLRRKTKNERKDHKGIDRDFFRYNICCNAACASDSGDIYTIAFILGAPYSEALCGFSAAYIQRPSI